MTKFFAATSLLISWLLICAIQAASAADGEPGDGIEKDANETFEGYMKMFNKTYTKEDLPRRLNNYQFSMKIIQQGIELFEQGKALFTMKPNEFTDWNEDELAGLTGTRLPGNFSLQQFGLSNGNMSSPPERMRRKKRDTTSLPASFTWAGSKCDPAITNQGTCGSCYAHSVMNAIEHTRCLYTGSLVLMSKEQVVDCPSSDTYNINGCQGGWPAGVYKYLQDLGSVASDSCYPYTLQNSNQAKSCTVASGRDYNSCKLNPSSGSGKIQYYEFKTESDVMNWVYNYGPVTSLFQSTSKFQSLGDGIFSDSSCSGDLQSINHAINIIGWGTQNGVDYWNIRNSWGTSWGVNGYAKILRGQNTCSIGETNWFMDG